MTCYNMNGPSSFPAGDLGVEAMALLSVFCRNFVPKVGDKPQPADGEVKV